MPEGQREINQLHIPVDRKIVLTLTSQDVIHDFDVPAFRMKHDVLPGRYVRMWFKATKAGTYHLFCGQYCGELHSQMIGHVIVMSATDYAHGSTTGRDDARNAGGRRLALLPRSAAAAATRTARSCMRRRWPAFTARPCRWSRARW